MKRILFLLIIFIIFSCKKQQENTSEKKVVEKIPPLPQKVIDKRTLIGFACYYAGSESNSVMKISEILKNKNYTNVKVKLFDLNPAEKYLATVACERLEMKNLIILTEKEFNQIKINKSSEEKLTICSGCTNEEELTLKKMFSSKENFLKESTEEWLKEMIK